MKIGILTQPLYMNYGGLLQAYALQTILKNEGHEVWIIQRIHAYNYSWLYQQMSWLKFLLTQIASIITCKKTLKQTKRDMADSRLYTMAFTYKYISPRSRLLSTDEALKNFVSKMNFDAFVVGSDQVWRPKYSPNIYNYFLDFAENMKVKRVAYAASFGTNDWEFSEEETQKCRSLIQKFDLVSVRENDGVTLCSEYLDRNDVKWVLDPTMLLPKEHYFELIAKAHLPEINNKHIVAYILDETPEKKELLNLVQRKLAKPIFDAQKGIEAYEAIHVRGKASVEEWLYGFQNADFAVVDSFHGCVFSILFHIPFVVIANEERGMSRFYSLLSMFGLEDRMIKDISSFDFEKMRCIDFEKIDACLNNKRKISLDFIKEIEN